MVEDIKNSLKNIHTDGLPMAKKPLRIYIRQHWNPYPTVRYTERPDTAAHLYEDMFVSLLMVHPVSSSHRPHFGIICNMRKNTGINRLSGLICGLSGFGCMGIHILLPLWYLFAVKPELLPETLRFIGPNEKGGPIVFAVCFD